MGGEKARRDEIFLTKSALRGKVVNGEEKQHKNSDGRNSGRTTASGGFMSIL